MTTTDNSTLWIIIALVGAALVIAIAVATSRRKRARSAELRQRFGPEYDRAVTQFGSRARAEHELAARARRVERIHINDLGDAERARFMAMWSRIQEQFVDDPAAAVAGASELIKEVMRVRGYPTDDFDQRAADLSVDHPDVVQHYRAARALSSGHDDQVGTEELRQAVVHYRALFAELLEPPGTSMQPLREMHA